MKKTKVHVPKVVVQTNPASRASLAVLLVTAAIVLAWLGYEIGRSQVTPVASGDSAVGEQAQAQIAALEKERDALKEKVAGLQRDVRLSRDALEVARKKVRSLERQPATEAEAVAPAMAAESPPAQATEAVSEPADNSLHLRDVRITRTEAEDRFRFSFSVVNRGSETDQVVGTIWIAVNGMLNGTPTRLPLDRVSASTRPFVKMDFRQRQEVEGELRLPPAFTPRNISIEAKPYSRKFTETSEKVDWVTGG